MVFYKDLNERQIQENPANTVSLPLPQAEFCSVFAMLGVP